MCDYCGCRRQPAIEELSQEHEDILELASQLRRLAAAGAHDDVVAVIDRDLAPLLDHHTSKEERGVFAELRVAWEADGRLDELVEEHRELERGLSEVRLGGAGWQRALTGLLHTLSEHILAEETDLFPYALYELRSDQWDAVEALHGAYRATSSV